jgi:hypothetical protein
MYLRPIFILAITALFILLPKQLNLGSSSPAHTSSSSKALCLLTNKACSVKPKVPPHHRHIVIKIAKKPELSLKCQVDARATISSYNANLLSYLNTTNAAVDQTRQQALSNGESYDAFDQQINSLTSSYNLKARALYYTDIKLLSGCKSNIAMPTLFQPFTP